MVHTYINDPYKHIQFDGGSDWFCLHRDFASYVANSDDSLMKGLRQYFMRALLPSEGFIHMALRNSRFCDTIIHNNLHMISWDRVRGCRCQQKAVVDWCGCSPLDIKPKDIGWLEDSERQKDIFFGRKFQAINSQVRIISRTNFRNTTGNCSMDRRRKKWLNTIQEIYHGCGVYFVRDEVLDRYRIRMAHGLCLANDI